MKIGSRYLQLLFLYALFLSGCSEGDNVSEIAKQDILNVLNQQMKDWNRGDIPAFMKTYVNSESLRFSSGGNVKRGWQSTYERYLQAYPNREAMGHLTFVDLEVLQLSPYWAEVHGRYNLKRGGDYADATGLFTLLLQQTEDGWKILHDHTSAGE